MRFNERKDFLYDPEVFKRSDTTTALKIYEEFVTKASPRPYPVFLEVDRRDQQFDPLWHMPTGPRTVFSREISIPVINTFEKPKFKRMNFGIQPKKVDYFLLAHNILQRADWFPLNGDMVQWNGYRYAIVDVVLDPSGFWQQTNVWMGLYVTAIIPPDGDARPGLSSSRLPSEAMPTPRR